MSPNFPSLRELRGAFLSVLLALHIENRPVTCAWLERYTGYSHKTLINSLAYFQENGFAARKPEGWLLTGAGRLLAGSFTPGGKNSNPGGKNSNPITINSNNDLNDQEEIETILLNEIGAEKIHPPEPSPEEGEPAAGKDPHQLQEIWQELAQAGIRPNQRTRKLAQLPHITPAYIRLHRQDLERSGRVGPQWAGLLITTLETGEHPPKLEEKNPHLKYITGRYAEFIEH